MSVSALANNAYQTSCPLSVARPQRYCTSSTLPFRAYQYLTVSTMSYRIRRYRQLEFASASDDHSGCPVCNIVLVELPWHPCQRLQIISIPNAFFDLLVTRSAGPQPLVFNCVDQHRSRRGYYGSQRSARSAENAMTIWQCGLVALDDLQ